MRKISSIKTSKILVLLLLMATVFVGCGSDDDGDDELGNWVKKSSFDGDARSGAASFTIGNKGYVFGGFDGDDRLNDLWVYDPDGQNDDNTNDFWSSNFNDTNVPLDSFPGVARNGAVGFSIGTKGYIGTGYDGDDELKDFYEYDSETNEWTQLADFPGTARVRALGFSINGFGYVGTGNDGSDQKDFYRYDPATNTWEQEFGFGGEKREEASAFVIDNIAYVLGGYENESSVRDFYSFDGTTWTQLTDLDDEDEDNEVQIARGSAFAIGGKGYVGVGVTTTLEDTLWEYTPADDSWDEVPGFVGSVRQYSSAFTFDSLDRAYILLGTNGSSYFNDVYEFEPDVLEDEDDD